MKKGNSIALIIAYYLSRYDQRAYESLKSDLGLSSQKAVHQEIGRVLSVNPNTVKNMRDAFDPMHDNARVGWYQVERLPPSRAKVAEYFQDSSEEDLYDVVNGILTNDDFVTSAEFADVLESIGKQKKQKKRKLLFSADRGKTGRKAEDFFVEYHGKTNEPCSGELLDKRFDGCGYDFEIKSNDEDFKVEVKGLSGDKGGISFTSKEWDVAKKNGDSYFVAIIRNVSSDPKCQLIRDPASSLRAKKSVFPVVQVRWNVTDESLNQSS